ncbi:XRE family transcriptional regulator [Marinobacter salarius]|jgi:hypothetical protein|uniref:XRE family transcriptional regulator n=1 Tax=Marinobacter salarius TaxID=1420917 RepID=UPI003BAD04F7
MTKVSLKEYTKGKTLAEVGEAINVTPGAVWQMLRSDRQIEITIHDSGLVEANEIKPVGRRSAVA